LGCGHFHRRHLIAGNAPENRVAQLRVIYPGNQAILFNALMSLTSPGDVVLTETLTFPGVKAAAEKLRLRLVGVRMDQEGILPEALKAACKEHKPKAVYLIPILHNPTTRRLVPSAEKSSPISFARMEYFSSRMMPTACWSEPYPRSRT
jgi:DNA-binding transcriptional MocR family regulator